MYNIQYYYCTQGSYNCGDCKPGYVNEGSYNCVLSDPCAAKLHNCMADDYCVNTAPGKYMCEVCVLLWTIPWDVFVYQPSSI